jgi:hypothetical protein
MMRRLLMSILLLWLASCTSSQQPLTKSIPAAKPSPNERSSRLPNVSCRGRIPKALLMTFGKFRLARTDDFIPKIQQLDRQSVPPGRPKIAYTCSVFTEDFDRDSRPDYAVLLVNPQTQTAQFRLAINQGKDRFKNVVIRDYPKPPQPISQPLYVAMFLKRSGELGAANRDYFPLKRGNPERKVFIANPAIELWLSPTIFRSGTSPAQSEAVRFDRLVGYGSENFYIVDRQLKTVRVAD